VNRLLGSPDIYRNIDDDPQKSINFITCHDGFTLWDLVSYNQKHNEANGEHNNDGNSCNFSSNYGVEGETRDPEILKLRMRQVKNMMLLNMYAMGTPMILMGDEVLRTQNGNNNAYCQDNEISYLNWNRSKRGEEMFNFVRKLISTRVNRGTRVDQDKLSIRNLADAIEKNQVTWHGVEPYQPDWSPSSHSIGMCVYSESSESYYYMFINSYWEGLHIKIPNVPSNHSLKWRRVVDTSLPPPLDFAAEPEEMVKIGHNYYVASHSILVLISDKSLKGSSDR
jgi:glycogen operon protein